MQTKTTARPPRKNEIEDAIKFLKGLTKDEQLQAQAFIAGLKMAKEVNNPFKFENK